MFEGNGRQSSIAVGGVVIKDALVNSNASLPRDFDSIVSRERVEDVDIIGPCDGFECSGKVVLFVFREDEDGDHLEVWYRGSGAALVPLCKWVSSYINIHLP